MRVTLSVSSPALTIFLIMGGLRGVKWYHSVVVMCIFLDDSRIFYLEEKKKAYLFSEMEYKNFDEPVSNR